MRYLQSIVILLNKLTPILLGGVIALGVTLLVVNAVHPAIAVSCGLVLVCLFVVLRDEPEPFTWTKPSTPLPVWVEADLEESTDESVDLALDADITVLDEIVQTEPILDRATQDVAIDIYVDQVYVRTVWFPKGRSILTDENALIRHARKYSDVAAAIRGRKVTTNFIPERLLGFHTIEDDFDPELD